MNKQNKGPLVHIVKRAALPWYGAWGIRALAILLALVACALVITMGISKVEEALRTGIPEEDACQFLRLGRSLVVNRNLIHYINAATQKLTFFDGDKSYLTIPVAKSLLRNLKAELGN